MSPKRIKCDKVDDGLISLDLKCMIITVNFKLKGEHLMIFCSKCGAKAKYYDTVKRIVRAEYGKAYTAYVQRYICTKCKFIHRILPDFLMPYKQYEKRIVNGFIFGTLTSDMLEYEDYPCTSTIKNWKLSTK